MAGTRAPTLKDQAKDHLTLWLLTHPEHARALDKVRRKVREWLR